MRHLALHRRALLTVVLVSVAWPAFSLGANDPLTRLFSELGARSERHAKFTERKFSALLKTPVESSGTLIFRTPGYLEKRTIEPQRETVKIDGSVVTYESAAAGGAQKRTFAVSDAPLLAALIESLRATLAGDLPALRRHYDVSFSGQQAQKEWQLTLVPRERALLDAVSKVVLRGAGSEVASIDIIEATGDLTLMQISAVPTPSAPIKK